VVACQTNVTASLACGCERHALTLARLAVASIAMPVVRAGMSGAPRRSHDHHSSAGQGATEGNHRHACPLTRRGEAHATSTPLLDCSASDTSKPEMMKTGKPNEYLQGFRFTPPTGDQGDRDKPFGPAGTTGEKRQLPRRALRSRLCVDGTCVPVHYDHSAYLRASDTYLSGAMTALTVAAWQARRAAGRDQQVAVAAHLLPLIGSAGYDHSVAPRPAGAGLGSTTAANRL